MTVNRHWLDEIGNTPMETMLDDILVTSAMVNHELDFLSALIQVAILFGWDSVDLWREYEESCGFTIVHKALLGIDESGLYNILTSLETTRMLSSIIDLPDSKGRSPLAWAVEHGWADATETLIKFGANVHQLRPSVYGGSPLLHLAIAGPDPRQPDIQVLSVVKILLQAGVDVNAKDHELWTATHIAASWNLLNIVMELIRFGGSTVDLEAVTNLGKSAFDLAIDAGVDSTLVDLLRSSSHVIVKA